MTALDRISLALCAWKENRHGGQSGMQSVMNVVLNRAKKQQRSVYAIVYAPLQFSSMTYKNDPQLLIQPVEELDDTWILAQTLAREADNNNLEDLTDGALFYYALTIPEPTWAKQMTETVIIANQRFMK